MNKPQSRLTDSQLARELLIRGKSVGAPASGAVHRTITRIEAAASAGLLVGGAGLGIAEAAVQSTALAGSSVLKSVGSWIVAKWFVSGMAVGIASGGVVAGAIVVGQAQSTDGKRPSAAASFSSAESIRTPANESKRIQSEEPPMTTASSIDTLSPGMDVAVGTLEAHRRVADAGKPRSVSPISPELARELGLLDRARAALERGEAAQAVRWLEQHRQRFPNGQLVPEAMLLRKRAESREPITGRR